MKRITYVIKERRKLLKITQKQVSKEIGISQQSYSLLEKQPESAPLYRLDQLAQILQIPLSDLIIEDSTKPVAKVTNHEELPKAELENEGILLSNLYKQLNSLTGQVKRIIEQKTYNKSFIKMSDK